METKPDLIALKQARDAAYKTARAAGAAYAAARAVDAAKAAYYAAKG